MSKIVKILGTGCPKCKSMSTLVSRVIEDNALDATVQKVEDIMEIMKYNVMSTPALVVDEEIVAKGRIPSKDEVLALLQ